MIFLSAGHSLKDRGATVNGISENILTMEIRDIVAETIGECEIIQDDLTLGETIEYINSRAKEGDIAIELHCNANNNPDVTGIEAYYYKDTLIAEVFSRNISKSCKCVNRGSRPDTETFVKELGFLRKVKCDSVLIECGYMTNQVELWMLTRLEYQKLIANGIFNAIQELELRKEIHWLQKKLVTLLQSFVSFLQGKKV